MGPTGDLSRLCPRTETLAHGYSLGEQREIFQLEPQHLGGCGWPRPRSGVGTELLREGMGRNPPLCGEGEEAETINTFAPVIQNPGVFTKGRKLPQPLRGPWAPAHPAQLGTRAGAERGRWPSHAQGHPPRLAAGTLQSSRLDPPSRRLLCPRQVQAGRAEGPVCSPGRP